jgi:glutamyl-tRNA(Gln) amidotransferase subunit E
MSDELVCGIEIHQQLDTKKLFCSCATELNEKEGFELLRRLRPTQSELGELDRAALAQAERRMRFRYQAPREVSCLVDADEEPPHDADADAVDISLIMSTLLGCSVVDEIHFMRKIVIDGSNTTGFQRTALVSVDGELKMGGKKIRIQSLCLEEDAARKVETKGAEVTYRLDRLGIPLVEIATGPDMRSPEEIKEVAQTLGSLLRATKRVKRGIGTIREDLNISIPGGARVEVKGVQELRMLPVYVRREMERQCSLLKVKDILLERKAGAVAPTIVDITAALASSKSKVIAGALARKGKVLGVRLPGYAGVLKSGDGALRLGAEMAQRARTKGVMGIFHSDELPGYGIVPEEVDRVRAALDVGKGDAFALCADDPAKAEAALMEAVGRANEAQQGVPEETRDPQPDGSTTYSRPLPGASRMYPETDVRPIPVTGDVLRRIKASLPEVPEAKVARFVSTYGIHAQQAAQLVRDGYEDIFEELASTYDLAAVAARTFNSTLPELEKEGAAVDRLDDDMFRVAFRALHEGAFAKEALPGLLRKLTEGKDVDAALNELGVSKVDSAQAEGIIAAIVKEREAFVREKGMGAMGPLMGTVMERLRGKIDGKAANELLRREIEKVLKS